MSFLLTLIQAAGLGCASAAAGRRVMHYLQLESYQLPGYIKSVKRNAMRALIPPIAMAAVGVAALKVSGLFGLALLLEALAYLNFGDYPARTVLCAYLLRMLDEAGFAPGIQQCMCCGAQRGWPMLEFESGGLCCRKCRPNACALPRGGPAFLRQARQGQIGALTAQDAAQLAEALLKYAQDALGQPLRAAALLDTAGPTNS